MSDRLRQKYRWTNKISIVRKIIKKYLNFLAELGLTDLDYYQYLSYGGSYRVDGTNDARDFQETLKGT